jgi:predicted outer membrane repeat protein
MVVSMRGADVKRQAGVPPGRRRGTRRTASLRALVAFVLIAAALAGTTATADAGGSGSCRVTNTTTGASVGPGSGGVLQVAINAARKGDTLEVRGVCVGEYTIAKTLQLVGVTTDRPATLYGRAGRPVVVAAGWPVSLSGLRITHGTAAGSTGAGRGIVNKGSMLLSTSTVTGNSADLGGGIFNKGSMTVSRSTINANTAGDGGGIYNSGTLSIRTSTLTANTAGVNQGGAIYSVGRLLVSHSTVAGNTAQWLGGGLSAEGPTRVEASILSGNMAGASGPECAGTVTSNGYNLIWTTDGGICDVAPAVGDQVGPSELIDAGLLGLADNGGPTRTMALAATSTALDRIPVGAIAADGSTRLCPRSGSRDQRWVARPQGSGCDIGAFELRRRG